MSFFDNLVSNGKALGNQISSAMGNAANQTGVDAKNSAERTSLEMEIATLNNELDKSYLLIGQRIVKLSATPLRNRPHMVFCSPGTFWGASSAHGTSVGCNPPAYP